MTAGRRWWLRSALLGAGATLALAGWINLPLPAERLAPPNDDAVSLLDRFGADLRTTRAGGGERRRWIPLAELDPDLLTAFVAAEDRRFYRHRGVDPVALLRAARQNVAAGRVVSGASTITMQLARLVHGSSRRWLGKVDQALWALRLDRQLPKQVILEQYLNRVPLGQGTEGVEAAAQRYFGLSARDLSLGEAALLAGIAGAPSRDNPLASLARAAARRDLVLDRIARSGGELAPAIARARLEPALGSGAPTSFHAPHFTSWVLPRVLAAPRVPGEVRTSIDLALQTALEAEVRHTVKEMHRFGAEHAALVVLANRTGEILAWVGSPDFFEPDNGQVDMVVSPRQPGSALKPFLYGAALDRSFTPASILADVATVYPTATGPYAPRNYDRRYRGPVRLREALGSSLNVPAVELANRIGVPPLLDVLHRAGFASLRRSAEHYGLGLALGNGDVTLLELANGYRAIANGGIARPVRWQAAVPGESGPDGTRVMSAAAAAQVLDIDPLARVAGFGPVTPLEFPFRAAAKTGTSRHFTDNWAVAVTGSFTVAVWVGNFSGRPMDGVSGVTGAGPLLHRAVLEVAKRSDPSGLVTPAEAGLVSVSVCRLSGLRATGRCPAVTEWFRPGTEPRELDTWEGPDGVALPAAFAEWAGRRADGNAIAAAGAMRKAGEPVAAEFRITSPRNGDRYRFVPGVDPAYATVALRAAGAKGAVRWFVDGVHFERARWALVPGVHRLRAVAGRDTADVAVEVEPQ
jgi:penicillin-binding protein 1C